MSIGWVKLHRKLLDKAFYSKDSEKVHFWIHLLLRANHDDYEEMLGGKPIICKPGQFTTGRKQLASDTGISESKIERLLTYFEKIEQQIEQQKTSTNRLISILNWEEYQQVEQRNEQRVNNKRTTSEQRVNTLQEYKEVKNKYIYSEFYDSEILKSANNEEYIKFVKVLFGDNNLKEPLLNVLKLKKQLTFVQFPLIMQKKKEYNCPITSVLENMENKPNLTKDYTSLQRTLLNWMKPKELRK